MILAPRAARRAPRAAATLSVITNHNPSEMRRLDTRKKS